MNSCLLQHLRKFPSFVPATFSSLPRKPVETPLAPPLLDGVAIVQLGRFGDIVNMLPIALHIHNTYRKPYVVVSRDCASILDGVSYATPFPVDLEFHQLNEAVKLANHKFRHVITAQVWGRGHTQTRLTPSYNREMWRVSGLRHQFTNEALRPLFDRPDAGRCARLMTALLDGRSYIITNLTKGSSSPYDGLMLLKQVRQKFGSQYQVIDIGHVVADRIYDLLPLLQRACAIVSIDTSILHLAAATNTPLVALRNNLPWLGTECRNAGAVSFDYTEVNAAPEKVVQAVETALGRPRNALVAPILPVCAPSRKLFHVISLYETADAVTRIRKQWAKDSWQALYAQGVIPAHCTECKRYLRHKAGRAKLPFIKDMLQPAMDMAGPDDIIFYTNDDIICHPQLPEQLLFHCSIYGSVAGQRCEILSSAPPALSAKPSDWAEAANYNAGAIPHFGRDLFAFTKAWLVSHWEEIPDFVIGAPEWDNCLTLIMRQSLGYLTTNSESLKALVWPAEMPLGYIAHLFHHSLWQNPRNYEESEPNQYNRRLFAAWAKTHAPALRFDTNNYLI